MELHDLKQQLQDHFTDGVVTIVGSGLSAAVGLPTMEELADHLLSVVPNDLPPEQGNQWASVIDRLATGSDLEKALREVKLDPVLEAYLIQLTADFIATSEKNVFEEVMANKLKLPLSRLFQYLLAANKSLPIVTTNYDRLIELAAEAVGIGVDTMFVGHHLGFLNRKRSRESLGFAIQTRKRTSIKRVYRDHIKLFKPHGSLDWFHYNGLPVRCSIPVNLPRLMITPGATKYLKGYDQPFDLHREAANHEIDNAARFLVLGYGFSDQQLETHLRPQLKRGLPCVILTKELTDNARAIIQDSPSIIALSECQLENGTGTRLTTMTDDFTYDSISIWNVPDFINEVLMA